MRVETIASLESVTAGDGNRLVSAEHPFLRHEFLLAAEHSGSVAPETGWHPCHLLLKSSDDGLIAAMPLYRKVHSWGEFVFDWAWANAYEQAGLAYYPKLVSAAPFTPASSPRLLCGSAETGPAGAALLDAALQLAQDQDLSSLHVQFPLEHELPVLERAGLKLRKDCQFHWRNRDYRHFDEFLAQFSSRKRKKVRRDRRAVTDQGIRFRWLHGNEIDATTWQTIYGLISSTFLRRGGMPYYNLAFFRAISQSLAQQVLVVLAETGDTAVAAAIFFVGETRLYGRYWGSNGRYDALHFETCYYQGIEYCIANGLDWFEPGTQGEHKVSRGFLPVTTWSAHWLAHDAFFDAIGRYLDEEQQHIERYIEAVDAHTPYRRGQAGGQ